MRRLFGLSLIAVFLLPLAQGVADAAGECQPAATTRTEPCCEQKCSCSAPCQRYCIVMKTCKEIVYDEEEITLYKTVYEEVVDKHVIDTVEYVKETQYQCVPVTDWQPEPPCACGPVDCCDATCRAPKMKPTCYLRKVPYPTYRAVPTQKTVEKPRVVVKRVPYTVTRCIPRVIYKQVPVKVCCPEPCCGESCCRQPTCM